MTAATRAVALDGKSVRHRLSPARVLWTNAQPDQAEVEARKALDLARTENERRSVQELLDFIQKNRRP